MKTKCEIVPTGKRRDGGTRYWCLNHKADATAKYGRPANQCRYAHIPPVQEHELLALHVADYPGGVAIWGAVPPVYDTTRLPLDRGIHVHARHSANIHKDIDATYRGVRLYDAKRGLPADGVVISELDAIYYMVTSAFGFEMKYVECTLCGWPHLDKDWFSVHAHRGHLCAGCGKHFRDADMAIGNPLCRLRDVYGVRGARTRPADRWFRARQSDYPGGLQIWGSNPAIVWTGRGREEEGIHIHAFNGNDERPSIDDTFAGVEIDGISFDAGMVRTLMAQSALPHIEGRIIDITCPECRSAHFDQGNMAFTPHVAHHCDRCGTEVRSSGRLRNTVGNPLVGVLQKLAASAPRKPQNHSLGLLPETL